MKQQGSVVMALAVLVGSAQAGPLTPLTDNFEMGWQPSYGFPALTRVSEFKSTLVDVFGQTVANPDGSTTTPRIQASGRAENSARSLEPGQRIDTYAHLQPRVRGGLFPEPAGPDGPVRVWAQTHFLDQKVFADSMRLVSVTSNRDVTRTDEYLALPGPPPVYAPKDPVTIRPRVENLHLTSAYSHWGDTWTVDKPTVVTLTFRAHAFTGVHLSADPSWGALADHMYGSGGDNFVVLDNAQMGSSGLEPSDVRAVRPSREVGASIQVFDMTHLRGQTEYCDEFGDCFPVMDPTHCPENTEMFNCGRPVAGTGFDRLRFAGAEQELWDSGANAVVEALLTLSFDAEVGAEYLAISTFSAIAGNGGWVDGSSTMSLLGINLSNDATLTSTAATRYGLTLPITRSNADPPGDGTVPEPGTLALLLAAGLLLQGQRLGAARQAAGRDKPGCDALV